MESFFFTAAVSGVSSPAWSSLNPFESAAAAVSAAGGISTGPSPPARFSPVQLQPIPFTSSTYPFASSSLPLPGISFPFTQSLPGNRLTSTPVSQIATTTGVSFSPPPSVTLRAAQMSGFSVLRASMTSASAFTVCDWSGSCSRRT